MDWYIYAQHSSIDREALEEKVTSFITSLWSGKDFAPLIKEVLTPPQKEHTIKKGKMGKWGDLTIYLVDGNLVKPELFMDFVEGGNDMVYGEKAFNKERKFIPPGEVWLDARLSIGSLPYVLAHELTERSVMEFDKGSKTEYDFEQLYYYAHNIASKFEQVLRSHKVFDQK